MRTRALLIPLGVVSCLALSASSGAAADVGNGLVETGVQVDLPAVPQVELPHVGVAPVDDAVDTVNETVRGATDTANQLTDSLDGGGGQTGPPASTPTPGAGGGPAATPVQTGSPAPAASGGNPQGGGQPGRGGGGSQSAGAGGGGAETGPAGAGAGDDGATPTTSQPAQETAPEQSNPIVAIFEALPWTIWALIGALALIGIAMSGRSAARARINRILRKQRGQLQEDVGALQSALLPAIPDRLGSAALAVAYRPAEGPAAGGDFHDVLELADGRIGIVVGDVCGHGREALANTALVHYTVRAYLEAGLEPREALRLANRALATKLDEDFVAVVAAVYDPSASTLDYATAGHPTPLIVGERDRSVSVLTPPPLGIGLLTGSRQTRVSIRPGNRVWFFTDGLVEARDAEGELIGREGLARILAESGDADPESILDRLAEVDGVRDDMTAFLLVPDAATGDGIIEEEIDVDRETATGDALPRFLAACGLDPGEVERAIDAARRRLRLAGSARIRARSGGLGARWEISGASATASPAAEQNGSKVEGETTLSGSAA